jgi:hypothetical protein
MPAPSVLIAANPYEGELCKKALAELGLEIELAESLDGALAYLAQTSPLAAVIADGWFGADARELLVEVRAGWERLPIFFVADRGADIADEAAAVRRGATRLFFRPIDACALAAAVEALAVEAERADDTLRETSVDPITERSLPRPGGSPRVLDGEAREIEAVPEHEWDEPPRPVGLPRVMTEVLPAPAARPARDQAALALGGEPDHSDGLLRADDALAEAAGLRFAALATSPGLRVEVAARERPRDPPAAPVTPPAAEVEPFGDRSTFARRLDRELSEAEHRLFPGSAPTARPAEDYQGALDDIDLDALGFDTLPGIGVEPIEPAPTQLSPPDLRTEASPLLRLAGERSAREELPPLEPTATPTPVPFSEHGSLDDQDLSELIGGLHAAGYSGRLQLRRGDGEKQLYFDAGFPVFASSTFAHDRLADQLYREGKLGREQHARLRDLDAPPGRRTAQRLVELGLLKPGELFPILRRHVEEIFYSLFSWDSGAFTLDPESAPAEDRLRLSAHPWALVLEGIRRKYGLERLAERLGPPDTVLQPTTNLARALELCELAPAERRAAELLDGERTIAQVESQVVSSRSGGLGEAALHALLWGLTAIGAVRREDHPDRLGVRAASTLVTSVDALGERRAHSRDGEAPQGDDRERAIDRERLRAKRAQIAEADYFAVLGLDRDATVREIDRAYERLRADFSPERFAPVDEELARALAEIGEVLEEAHRVLMDEAVRGAYRLHLGD